MKKPHLLYPDFTVGTGITPVQPYGSWTLPPVGNYTLPLKMNLFLFFNQLHLNLRKEGKLRR